MHNLSYLSASRLIGLVSFYFKEVVALFVGEQFADMADRLPELIIGPGCGLLEQRFQLCECHLNRIEV